MPIIAIERISSMAENKPTERTTVDQLRPGDRRPYIDGRDEVVVEVEVTYRVKTTYVNSAGQTQIHEYFYPWGKTAPATERVADSIRY
jgi:hypothetical protein